MKKIISILILSCFFTTSEAGNYYVYAQEFRLPAPGVMVPLSPEFNPPILKGIKVHSDNPFRFDFILDQGDNSQGQARIQNQEQLKIEATKLIKYFLASLTIPENDLWVNLSPYEKNRIIPQSFGLTEMGRDLLAEDYMLKQITASLIYPEDAIGKKFWKRIYEEAEKKFGTTNIPVNTFNKVWIVPDKAVVYENVKAGAAYVVESKLKVMLEQDYLSLQKHQGQPGDMALAVSPSTLRATASVRHKDPSDAGLNAKALQVNNLSTTENINALGSQIVREIVIPELTKEVNEDKNFAQLRQVYDSLILATWYKKKIKDSILAQVYTDRKKVAGVGYDQSVIPVPPMNVKATQRNEANDVELIYQRYLQAFKKGVYNYIKEEPDPMMQENIPKKYFSGGMLVKIRGLGYAPSSAVPISLRSAAMVTADFAMAPSSEGHTSDENQLTGDDKARIAKLKTPKQLEYLFDFPLKVLNESDINNPSDQKIRELLLKLRLYNTMIPSDQRQVFETVKSLMPRAHEVFEYCREKLHYDPVNISFFGSYLWSPKPRDMDIMIIVRGDVWTTVDIEDIASLFRDHETLMKKVQKVSIHIIGQDVLENDSDPRVPEGVILPNRETFINSVRARTNRNMMVLWGREFIEPLNETHNSMVQVSGFLAHVYQRLSGTYEKKKDEDENFRKVAKRLSAAEVILRWFQESPVVSEEQQSRLSQIGINEHPSINDKRFLIDMYELICQAFESFAMRSGDWVMPRTKGLEEVKKYRHLALTHHEPNTGGIDLTSSKMNLQTKVVGSRYYGDDRGIKFHLDPAMLRRLRNAPGIVPVIINIQPMTNLWKFLGITPTF